MLPLQSEKKRKTQVFTEGRGRLAEAEDSKMRSKGKGFVGACENY